MRKVLAGLILLSLWQISIGADTQASIDAIVTHLSPPDYSPQPFVERRQNKLLAEPMVLEGEVTFFEDGTFSKVILTPFSERILVTNKFLELERNGKKRRVSLRRDHGARALYVGLRAFLEQDLDTLLTLFEVVAIDPADPWRIELVPVADDAKRFVAKMIITGSGPNVTSIRTIQTENNWQEMLFGFGERP